MKKLSVVLLCMIIVLFLYSCSSSEAGTSSTYTVTKNGTDYVVDSDNGTISDGTHSYRYEISGSSSGYSINITYPDGSAYWRQTQKSDGSTTWHGGWSDNYDANRYIDGDTLCDVLEEDIPKEKGSRNVLLILFLFVVGIFTAVSPHTAWYLGYGWRYKNAEPSDLALGLNRFGGVVVIIVAAIIFFI